MRPLCECSTETILVYARMVPDLDEDEINGLLFGDAEPWEPVSIPDEICMALTDRSDYHDEFTTMLMDWNDYKWGVLLDEYLLTSDLNNPRRKLNQRGDDEIKG